MTPDDPNKVLDDLRELASYVLGVGNPELERALDLAEAFSVLDEWICNDGFLPTAWAGRA